MYYVYMLHCYILNYKTTLGIVFVTIQRLMTIIPILRTGALFVTQLNLCMQREALDRLSKQLVQIQDKVYEAACKSVESMGSRLLTRACKSML